MCLGITAAVRRTNSADPNVQTSGTGNEKKCWNALGVMFAGDVQDACPHTLAFPGFDIQTESEVLLCLEVGVGHLALAISEIQCVTHQSAYFVWGLPSCFTS